MAPTQRVAIIQWHIKVGLTLKPAIHDANISHAGHANKITRNSP